jgi:hypothetical protein
MTMDPDELESLIDRELGELPRPRAPRSLLPRVLEAAAEARRPWHARAWRTWPIAWQAASVVACALFLAGAAFSLPVVQSAVGVAAAPVGALLQPTIGRIIEIQRATEVVWRVLIGPVAIVALVPVMLMLAASLAFGTALRRLAYGGATQL